MELIATLVTAGSSTCDGNDTPAKGSGLPTSLKVNARWFPMWSCWWVRTAEAVWADLNCLGGYATPYFNPAEQTNDAGLSSFNLVPGAMPALSGKALAAGPAP